MHRPASWPGTAACVTSLVSNRREQQEAKGLWLVYTAQHSKGHKIDQPIHRRPPCIARKHASHIIKCMQKTTLASGRCIWMSYLTNGKQPYVRQYKCASRGTVSHIFHGVNWPPKLNSSMAVATWQHACRELWHATATHFIQNHMPSMADGSMHESGCRACRQVNGAARFRPVCFTQLNFSLYRIECLDICINY